MSDYEKYKYFKRKYLTLKKEINQRPNSNYKMSMDLFYNFENASSVFSPQSIMMLLSMIMQNTNNDILKILDFKEIKNYVSEFNPEIMDIDFFLIFDDFKIKKKYLDNLKGLAHVVNKNFDESRAISYKVNNFISRHTNSAIKNILSENDLRKNSLVVINTVYFRVKWFYKFNANETTSMTFHKTDTDVVEMMHQINRFHYFENDLIKLVEIPFHDVDYVMGIILPKDYMEEDNMNYSINNIPQFTSEELEKFTTQLKPVLLNMYIPKFERCHHNLLNTTLEKIGWSNILKKLSVSRIIHKVFFSIDENGEHDVNSESYNDAKDFTANHSFIYYVRYLPKNIFLLFGDYQGT